MEYRIFVSKSKHHRPTDLGDKNYWSHTKGCFCSYDEATTFESFEDAQPTVQKLRSETAYFVYAVRI